MPALFPHGDTSGTVMELPALSRMGTASIGILPFRKEDGDIRCRSRVGLDSFPGSRRLSPRLGDDEVVSLGTIAV